MHSPKLNNLMLSGLSIQTLTLAYGMLLIIKSNVGVSTATSRYDILGRHAGVRQEEIEKDRYPRGVQMYRNITKMVLLLFEFQKTSACNA